MIGPWGTFCCCRCCCSGRTLSWPCARFNSKAAALLLKKKNLKKYFQFQVYLPWPNVAEVQLKAPLPRPLHGARIFCRANRQFPYGKPLNIAEAAALANVVGRRQRRQMQFEFYLFGCLLGEITWQHELQKTGSSKVDTNQCGAFPDRIKAVFKKSRAKRQKKES